MIMTSFFLIKSDRYRMKLLNYVVYYLHCFDIQQWGTCIYHKPSEFLRLLGKNKLKTYQGISSKATKMITSMFLNQGDAEYLRYHGMQEFDRAMQHLEERYGVSFQILLSTILFVNEMPKKISLVSACDLTFVAHHWFRDNLWEVGFE